MRVVLLLPKPNQTRPNLHHRYLLLPASCCARDDATSTPLLIASFSRYVSLSTNWLSLSPRPHPISYCIHSPTHLPSVLLCALGLAVISFLGGFSFLFLLLFVVVTIATAAAAAGQEKKKKKKKVYLHWTASVALAASLSGRIASAVSSGVVPSTSYGYAQKLVYQPRTLLSVFIRTAIRLSGSHATWTSLFQLL